MIDTMSARTAPKLRAVFVSLPGYNGLLETDALWIVAETSLTPWLKETLSSRPSVLIDAENIPVSRMRRELCKLGYDCHALVAESDRQRFAEVFPPGKVWTVREGYEGQSINRLLCRVMSMPLSNPQGRKWLSEQKKSKLTQETIFSEEKIKEFYRPRRYREHEHQ